MQQQQEIFAGANVQIGRRFVQDQDWRVGQQSQGQRQALLQAAGEIVHRLVQMGHELQAVQQGFEIIAAGHFLQPGVKQ